MEKLTLGEEEEPLEIEEPEDDIPSQEAEQDDRSSLSVLNRRLSHAYTENI